MSHSTDVSRDQIDRLAEDFLARYRRGDRPSSSDVSNYARQFPEIGEQVAEVIQVLLLMENLGAEPIDDDENASIPIPEQLGEYRIVRELGRGGMGVVYEAIQAELGRRVALKVLPAVSLLKSSQLARFRREAKAAARLHHSNIVPVFGVGSKDGVHYYAMQLIEGRSLDHVLKEIRRQRSVGGSRETLHDAGEITNQSAISNQSNGQEFAHSVARIGQQIADALSHAHSQGMLHRDVKPSNIILDLEGRAWLSDFGMALFDDSEQLTGTGDVVGTLRYMAPERFKGQSDARSDVYSLGLTLYELLTAKSAVFEVDRAKLVHQVLNEDPPAPRTVEPSVPRDLETIVLKAICKEPAHRYQSAADLREDLSRFLSDRPPAARRLRWWERVRRWVKRNRALTYLATAAFATLFLGLGMTYTQWQRAEWNFDVAKRQTDRAQKGYDALRKMVDGLFDAFSGDSLTAESMPLALRKYLLALAVDHHRELNALSDDDPESQAELARSYLRIAELQISVGSDVKAVEVCEEAEELMLRATRQYPDQPNLRALLASVTSQLGYYRLGVNRVSAARETLDRAIAIWTDLLAKQPGEPDYLNGLAKSYNCLGYLLSPEKSPHENLGESIRLHESAVAIRRELVSRFPDSAAYKQTLSLAISNLASRKSQTQAFEEATRLQEESNSLFEELLASNPDSVDLQFRIAKGHNHLGDKFRDFRVLPDRYDRAIEEYLRALDAQERFVNQNPGVVPLKRDLANTLDNLAEIHYRKNEYTEALTRSEQVLALFDEMLRQDAQSVVRDLRASALGRNARVLVKLGRRDEAISSYLRSVQAFRDLVEANDERPWLREGLSKFLRELTPLLRQAGRFKEAIDAVKERRKLATGNGDELYSAAQDLAEIADSLAQNHKSHGNHSGRNESQRTANGELRAAADLSLDVLLEAIDSGWKNFAQLQIETPAGQTPFVTVWERARYTKLPPELAFAFDVRARSHLADAEFYQAMLDWTQLVAQGLIEPSTYRALARTYLNFPPDLPSAGK